MTNVILLAAPAAGKGTLAAKLKKEYNMEHISTGDLLRKTICKNNSEGNMINELISNGKFVSDDIVFKLLKEEILQLSNSMNYILDGFPRNINQAKQYDKFVLENKLHNRIVIVLDVDKKIAKSRIEGRYVCPKCGEVYNINTNMIPKLNGYCDICNTKLVHRSDDNTKIYEERYKTYIEKTLPLITYYEDNGKVYHINANGSSNDTYDQVVEILGDKND